MPSVLAHCGRERRGRGERFFRAINERIRGAGFVFHVSPARFYLSVFNLSQCNVCVAPRGSRAGPFASCPALFCFFALSCPVLSFPVLTCTVLSGAVLSCSVPSRPVPPRPVPSHPILSHPAASCGAPFRPVLFRPVPSCLGLFCCVLSFSDMACHVRWYPAGLLLLPRIRREKWRRRRRRQRW